MYKKYLIVASKLDKAGSNITLALSQFRKNPLISSMGNEPSFDFYLAEEEIIYTGNLSLDKINHYDFIIFASKHRSEKGGKTLSVHVPGNWNSADFGGTSGKICRSSALFQKQMFEKLNIVVHEHDLRDYNITLECTHHGPLINKPCVFIEIGSTETEWQDRRAAFIVAKTISETISEFKENPYNEIAVGIGGPHYCPNFNRVQAESNVAISHVIPEYAMPITESMIKEAIANTEEEVDFVLIDWKGLGQSEQRQQVLNILDRNYIAWKKASDVWK